MNYQLNFKQKVCLIIILAIPFWGIHFCTYADGCTGSTFSVEYSQDCQCWQICGNYYNDCDVIQKLDWDFGDGDTASGFDPCHTYTSPGTYTVTMSIRACCHGLAFFPCSNTVQCQTSNTITVTQAQINNNVPPQAVFIADTVCLGTPTSFSNLSQNSTGSSWLFGDGDTSSANTPSHIYDSCGIFHATLIAGDGTCCTSSNIVQDTISKPVYVKCPPNNTPIDNADTSGVIYTSSASINADSALLGQPISFDLITTDSITAWTWMFSDTGTSNLRSPQHVYEECKDSTTHPYADVIVTNTQGCNDTVREFIDVFCSATFMIMATNDTICLGDTANIMVSPSSNNSITWSTGDTSTSITVSPTTTSQYNVTVTDTTGDSVTRKSTVLVHDPPSVHLPDTSFCSGNSINLNAGYPNAQHFWSNGNDSQSISVDSTGQYSVMVTDSNGCSNSDTTMVSSDSALIVTLTDTSICPSDSVMLDAGHINASYNWSTGDTTQTIIVTQSRNIVVTVTSIDTNICAGSDTATIVVQDTINPTINYCLSDTTVIADSGMCGSFINMPVDRMIQVSDNCAIDTIFNHFTGSSNATAIYPVDTTSITWTATDMHGNSSSCQTDIIVQDTTSPTIICPPDVRVCGSQVVNYPLPTTFDQCGIDTLTRLAGLGSGNNFPVGKTVEAYQVTDNTGNTASCTITVNVDTIPLTFFNPSANLCIDGPPVQLNSGFPAGGSYSGPGINNQQLVPSQAGIGQHDIIYTYTNSYGCSSSDTASITVHEPTIVNIGSDDTICTGDTVRLTATGGLSYQWSSGDTGKLLDVATINSTKYKVTVTDSNGCSATDSLFVRVNSLPIVDVNGNQSICSGDSIQLTASGGGNYDWSNDQIGATINVSPSTTTEYSVTVTDSNGCHNSDSIKVVVTNSQDPTISGVDSIFCQSDQESTFNGTPAGGSFNGPGMNGNMFNPSEAGIGQHQITYSYTDSNNCTWDDTVQLQVTICSGIKPIDDNVRIKAYPNPFSDVIFLQINGSNSPPLHLALYDITGQLIVDKTQLPKIPRNQYRLTIPASLSTGVYLLRVKLQNQIVNLKMGYVNDRIR